MAHYDQEPETCSSFNIMRVVIIAVLCAFVTTYTKEQFSDYFFFSAANGNSVLVLNDGTLATIGVQWVGLSAWYDLNGIQQWYSATKSAGQIPYFHDYGLGTIIYNTRNISYAGLLEFDNALADMIGQDFAFVNLDTEWDAGGIAPYAVSAAGIQSFKDRIAIFRQKAPNAILSSSAGLWSVPYGAILDYYAFTPVDRLLDLRSTLYSAVSNVDSCCWRQLDGQGGTTTMFTDGKAISTAQQTASILNANKVYMDNLWGTTSRKWYAADVAVTDCGWGVSGQTAIIKNLVDNLQTMFANGFRGIMLRNYSPPNQFRFMGQNNEAGFTWYPPSSGVYTTAVEIARGLGIVRYLMKNKATSAPAISAPRSVTAVTPGWNSWWIQVQVTPFTDVTGVKATYTDATGVSRSATLSIVETVGKSQWMGAPPTVIPYGASVSITLTLQSGKTETHSVKNGQSISVAKTLPGWNSWWIQVGVSPGDSVGSVGVQYIDWNGATQYVTLTKNVWGSYMAPPPTQIPYGAECTVFVYLRDSTVYKYTVKNGEALTVTTVPGAWNSWWIQVQVTPNEKVTSVAASFYDTSGWKRVVTLSPIAGTQQYMASPVVQMREEQEVVISVTLSDGTLQTYSVYNNPRSEAKAEPREHDIADVYPWWVKTLLGIGGTVLSTALLSLVVVGILAYRRSRRDPFENFEEEYPDTPETPQSPVDHAHPVVPGEEMIEIEEAHL